MVHFFFPREGICTADLCPRGACQPAPTSRQTRIQWKLKAACSFPPRLSEMEEGEGGSSSPCFVWISSPSPFSAVNTFCCTLRSKTTHRNHKIKIRWWIGPDSIYYLLEYKRLIACPHPHAATGKSRLWCTCSHGSILDHRQLPPKSSEVFSSRLLLPRSLRKI